MQGDKEIRNKLAETEENVDMLHGAIQILVGGGISSWLGIKLPSVSIVGLLIFQILSLFVLAECYELDFVKILIDLMLKSKRNL